MSCSGPVGGSGGGGGGGEAGGGEGIQMLPGSEQVGKTVGSPQSSAQGLVVAQIWHQRLSSQDGALQSFLQPTIVYINTILIPVHIVLFIHYKENV